MPGFFFPDKVTSAIYDVMVTKNYKEWIIFVSMLIARIETLFHMIGSK